MDVRANSFAAVAKLCFGIQAPEVDHGKEDRFADGHSAFPFDRLLESTLALFIIANAKSATQEKDGA